MFGQAPFSEPFNLVYKLVEGWAESKLTCATRNVQCYNSVGATTRIGSCLSLSDGVLVRWHGSVRLSARPAVLSMFDGRCGDDSPARILVYIPMNTSNTFLCSCVSVSMFAFGRSYCRQGPSFFECSKVDIWLMCSQRAREAYKPLNLIHHP